MNKAVSSLFAVALAAVIAGCAAGVPAPNDDPRFARALADTAVRAAVAKPGARVCREMQVGIAERDWVRGVVVAADGPVISVRVENAGRFAHTLNGAEVRKSTTVRDDPKAWIPCVGSP